MYFDTEKLKLKITTQVIIKLQKKKQQCYLLITDRVITDTSGGPGYQRNLCPVNFFSCLLFISKVIGTYRIKVKERTVNHNGLPVSDSLYLQDSGVYCEDVASFFFVCFAPSGADINRVTDPLRAEGGEQMTKAPAYGAKQPPRRRKGVPIPAADLKRVVGRSAVTAPIPTKVWGLVS